jgi:hypothetical protein
LRNLNQFKEPEALQSFIEEIFPDFETQLEIVPTWNLIKEHLLFFTDENGQLVKGSEEYIGEVKLFKEQFIEHPSLNLNGFILLLPRVLFDFSIYY